MITVQLSGGFGNQLFQYATGLSLACRLDTKCCIDLGAYRKNIRKYELENLNIKPIVANSKDLPFLIKMGYLNIPGRSIVNKFTRSTNFNSNIFIESSPFMYDERFQNLKDNTYLIGYYQTEKYFNKYSTDIRNQFKFPTELSFESQKIQNQILNSESPISVHVRRGDYVSNPSATNYHGICSIEYYLNAFQCIESKIKNPTYFVFSDDPNWAKLNIKPNSTTFYIQGNAINQDIEDFRLMSSCSHHIIANSSFSWWAAWLNSKAEKITIAPQKWIASTEIKFDDILPKSWIAI